MTKALLLARVCVCRGVQTVENNSQTVEKQTQWKTAKDSIGNSSCFQISRRIFV